MGQESWGVGERLLLRFEVFGGKDPCPAEKVLSGAWDPRFGDEEALLECLRFIVYDVEMWSRISGGRYGFGIAVPVRKKNLYF